MALLTKNLYKIQEVISAGRIGGLLTPNNPLYSVTLDDTPMAKLNGEENFKGASVEIRDGDEVQAPVPGFEDVAQTLTGTGTLEPLEWNVMQIPAGFNRTKVVIRSPGGVYRFSSKGKYQSWNFYLDIEVSTDESEWIPVRTIRNSYRTQQDFDFVQLVVNPLSNWDQAYYIRVRRASGYGNERETWNPQWFASVILQSSANLTYPNTAYASVTFDSASFGTGLPVRGYRFKGIECLVPTIYNPTEYNPVSGEVTSWANYSDDEWDGEFKEAHCDDPAWIAYTILVNEVWGAGRTVNADAIDIYELFEISKYNVEIVDDGENPPQPRFIWNGRISSVGNMRSMVGDILATCNAALYEEDGILKFFQDRPTFPTAILMRNNVIDGDITFTTAPLEGRISAVEVTYNDRSNRFEPSTELVTSDEAINAFGYRQQNIMQNGVVDRPQAIRAARWEIENSLVSAQSATCSVGWENWDIEIGDVVYIVDETIYDDAVMERVESIDGDIVTLRNPLPRSFTDEPIYINGRTGLIITTATGIEGAYTFTLDNASGVSEHDSFAITDNTLPEYRVNGFKYNEGEKSLNFGFHDPTKYGRIEVGEPYDPIYPPRDDEGPNTPRQLRFFPNTVDGYPNLVISWRAPEDKVDPTLDDTNIAYYELDLSGQGEETTITTVQTEFEIAGAGFGVYEVDIRAVDARGVSGPELSGSYDFQEPNETELLPPATINGDFSTKDLSLSWVDNPSNATHPVLAPLAYILTFSEDNVVQSRRVRVLIDDLELDSAGSYVFQYNYDMNTQDHGEPSRTIYASIAVEDNEGGISGSIVGQFENPVPAAPVVSLTAGFSLVLGEISAASADGFEPDVDGFLLDVNGVVTDLKSSANFSFGGEPGVTYTVSAAAYDLFNREGLNWSAPQDIEVLEIEIPEIPELPDTRRREFTFSGLEFTWLNAGGGATGNIAWGQHTAIRTIVTTDGDTGDETGITEERQTVAAGSLTYNAANQLVVYDWNSNSIILQNFDNWYGLDRHLHGTYSSTTVFTAVTPLGTVVANKIAANAISATHIQADAVKAINIAVDEKLQVGGTRGGNNFGIILDGTATADNAAVIWAGDSFASGANAAFAVTREGRTYSRLGFESHGDILIGGNGNIQGDLIVGGTTGNYVMLRGSLTDQTGIALAAGFTAPGDVSTYKWGVTPQGRMIARNSGQSIVMDLNPVTNTFLFNGTINAQSGTIGAATIGQEWLDVATADTGGMRVMSGATSIAGFGSTPNSRPPSAGNVAAWFGGQATTAPCYITDQGDFYAQNGRFEGEIIADRIEGDLYEVFRMTMNTVELTISNQLVFEETFPAVSYARYVQIGNMKIFGGRTGNDDTTLNAGFYSQQSINSTSTDGTTNSMRAHYINADPISSQVQHTMPVVICQQVIPANTAGTLRVWARAMGNHRGIVYGTAPSALAISTWRVPDSQLHKYDKDGNLISSEL